MADATYLLGSNQYVVVELERTALSASYTPANWIYALVLKRQGEVFDGDSETWETATYELATDSEGETHHTVKALLPDLVTVKGKYNPFVKMTSLSETETPTYVDAAGVVTVK